MAVMRAKHEFVCDTNVDLERAVKQLDERLLMELPPTALSTRSEQRAGSGVHGYLAS